MIGSLIRQPSLFFFAFHRELAALSDPRLDQIDPLLNDPDFLQLVHNRLAARASRSKNFGRPSIAPDRLLRCAVLKHCHQWSLRQLESQLRINLVYRRFTRFYEDPIPDASTFCRSFALLGAEGTYQIHQRLVQLLKQNNLICARKLRTDTTVVETNIHYPADSSLLADGIRVLTQNLKRLAQEGRCGKIAIVDHTRSAKHRVLEICRAAKAFTVQSQEQLKTSYGKLLGLTRGLLGKTSQVLKHLEQHPCLASAQAERSAAKLRHYLPLVSQVVEQTKARVFQGNVHFPHKILSLFEEHSALIRKGKIDRPNEFGRLIRLDEVEQGIVSNYAVLVGNPGDQGQWLPALAGHQQIFGHFPRLAAADRGFFSAANEASAQALGVKQVVLPARGKLSTKRRIQQKQRWFQRGQGWRAGIEGRIATLKHRFGLKRAFYKSDQGFQRYVGWCIISQNLSVAARLSLTKKSALHVSQK